MRSISGVDAGISLTWDNNPRGHDFNAVVRVNDAKLREQLPGFDGLEKAFMLVPQPSGEWKRFELNYSQTYGTDLGPRTDIHSFAIPSPFLKDAEINAIRGNGVAFGLETNVGTLWLQDPGDNAKP
jgi:hypothetical protein